MATTVSFSPVTMVEFTNIDGDGVTMEIIGEVVMLTSLATEVREDARIVLLGDSDALIFATGEVVGMVTLWLSDELGAVDAFTFSCVEEGLMFGKLVELGAKPIVLLLSDGTIVLGDAVTLGKASTLVFTGVWVLERFTNTLELDEFRTTLGDNCKLLVEELL